MSDWGADWTKAAFASNSNPSFADLLKDVQPQALPPQDIKRKEPPTVPQGTTILALTFADGVVMAGDRRATEGYQIADRYIVKVFPADHFSAVAIAGAAGPAIDMVRLFQTELEHYEKVEGEVLSLEGKANKLAQMIKANFPMAMQGLIVVPLFAGFDRRRSAGRIFRYDAVVELGDLVEGARGVLGHEHDPVGALDRQDRLAACDALARVVRAVLHELLGRDVVRHRAHTGDSPVAAILPITSATTGRNASSVISS